MKRTIIYGFVFGLLICTLSYAGAAKNTINSDGSGSGPEATGKKTVFKGEIQTIERDYLTMDGTEFKLIHPSNSELKAKHGFQTECWVAEDSDRYMLTLDTLIAVGHVDLARIVLKDGFVSTIHVLKMLQ